MSALGGGSSVGRAPGCGPGGRGFESRPPPLHGPVAQRTERQPSKLRAVVRLHPGPFFEARSGLEGRRLRALPLGRALRRNGGRGAARRSVEHAHDVRVRVRDVDGSRLLVHCDSAGAGAGEDVERPLPASAVHPRVARLAIDHRDVVGVFARDVDRVGARVERDPAGLPADVDRGRAARTASDGRRVAGRSGEPSVGRSRPLAIMGATSQARLVRVPLDGSRAGGSSPSPGS
jgi:hypothetical protein